MRHGKWLAAAFLALGVVGCGGDGASEAPVSQVDDEGELRESVECVALRAAPGRPMVFFAPFDPVEDQVVCMLDAAEREIFIAHYNIRRQRVLDRLVAAARRGVQVRVAVDRSNAEQEWNTGDDFLEANGIEVVRAVPPSGKGIMHLKVTVIDQEAVMTGSFNWNETAALANDENMLVLRDTEAAARYRQQVLEVLGAEARRVDPPAAGQGLSVRFSPEEFTDKYLVAEIDKAQSSVDMAMFTFTMDQVSDALVRAVKRGVKVRAVVEKKQTNLSTADDKLEASGALLVRGANRISDHSAMHHKYAVVDGSKVLTGATNWTFSGTRVNEEDLLTVDVPEVAAAYRKNFADLLRIYGGVDDDDLSLRRERSPVLFHTIHGGTSLGDRVMVVGSHPLIGSWEPSRGVPFETDQMFPNWTARGQLPAGERVEYKFVTLRANGSVDWEQGPNRVLDVPASGRAIVRSGTYGDTGDNWSPTAEGR